MNEFKVIKVDFNRKKLEEYDILPYFRDEWKKDKAHPRLNIESIKKWIEKKSMYQFWSRYEYEVLISDLLPNGIEEKWDVHRQIMMNIDIITKLFIAELIK